MAIEVKIQRKLNTFELNIDFKSDSKRIGILGASGCGKSMTLKSIAGIEPPESGLIKIEGKTVYDSENKVNLKPQKRNIGYLFQNYALYPHLTVKQNILFPLQNLKGKDKLSRSQMDERAQNAARLVQITELMDRRPSELSGGQQQRVAIARALVKMPVVINRDNNGSYSVKTTFLPYNISAFLPGNASIRDRAAGYHRPGWFCLAACSRSCAFIIMTTIGRNWNRFRGYNNAISIVD